MGKRRRKKTRTQKQQEIVQVAETQHHTNFPLIKGRTNALWRWDTLEDVKM